MTRILRYFVDDFLHCIAKLLYREPVIKKKKQAVKQTCTSDKPDVRFFKL